MDNPIEDIPKIIQFILGSSQKNEKEQKRYVDEITKYYQQNVEYKNFIFYIASNKHSLENFIALNRFYRVFIWSDKTRINDIWYNEETKKAVIEVTQTMRRGIFFWIERRTRLIIKLDLTYGNDGKYIIRRQEDLLQPEEFAGSLIPLVVPTLIAIQKFIFSAIVIGIGRCLELIGCS
ncbi:hypothetical protein C1645_814352 [Glomus cerebriforme]|uniref:SigF-like NTF2-like domain-containing protein n=1 Tax=Glomus cerebriforme TaxID=658196 RepID=A0A397TG79_9GLOM|nr:hypothetical protein C1645_814352 [Glomus cerebriforme]